MTKLYVRESGTVGSPAILFLHGAGLSGRMWEPQVARLSEFHCLAPDLPEQGQSAGTGPFELHDAARLAGEVIAERVPAGKAHVVGLSLGGAVALTMMRLESERVDHTIVSGASSGLGKLLGAMLAATGFLYSLAPGLMIDAALNQMEIPREYHAACREDMWLSLTPDFNSRMVQALTDLTLPQATTSPLLAVVGEKETLPAKDAAHEIVATVPGARGVLVPKAGHVWNLEAPDLFSDMVRAWATDTPLPSALKPLP